MTLRFFLVLHEINKSGINLNNDFEKISCWAFQWKMSFNPDINKQAHEVIFSRKLLKSNHPSLTFNGTYVTNLRFKNTDECFWIQNLILRNM